MSSDSLWDREEALRDEFYRRVDGHFRARLREKLDADDLQRSLTRATGIRDECILQELDSLDVDGECVLALSLYMIVHVAWSDGWVADRERAALLEAAESIGHRRNTASGHLLDAWLEHTPSDEMFTTWKDYVTALLEALTPVARSVIRRTLVGRSEQVAKAVSEILGIPEVSAVEEAALAELDAVFAESCPARRPHS